MDKLLYFLPALACPIGMGLMMWLMMRPKAEKSDQTPSVQAQQLARLRSEIAALRDDQSDPVTAPKYYPAS